LTAEKDAVNRPVRQTLLSQSQACLVGFENYTPHMRLRNELNTKQNRKQQSSVIHFPCLAPSLAPSLPASSKRDQRQKNAFVPFEV
jgi:hypothetical protein